VGVTTAPARAPDGSQALLRLPPSTPPPPPGPSPPPPSPPAEPLTPLCRMPASSRCLSPARGGLPAAHPCVCQTGHRRLRQPPRAVAPPPPCRHHLLARPPPLLLQLPASVARLDHRPPPGPSPPALPRPDARAAPGRVRAATPLEPGDAALPQPSLARPRPLLPRPHAARVVAKVGRPTPNPRPVPLPQTRCTRAKARGA
jgi:hypothetical protein